MSTAGPAAPAIATAEKSSAGNTFSMRRSAIENPSVARRSPAITMPSANRSARIVVPCGIASGVLPSAAGSMPGSSRRTRSENDGLGSGENAARAQSGGVSNGPRVIQPLLK